MSERLWGVVPAAGVGRRMGGARPKQYLPLAGRTVLEHSVTALLAHPRMEAVVVALQVDDPYWPALAMARDPRVLTAPGGEERMHSVLNGLRALEGRAAAQDWVLVHDAARPCLRGDDLARLVDNLTDHPVGGLLALPMADTVKRAGEDGSVVETVDRSCLWRALTPQMFRYHLLRSALEAAVTAGVMVTDESQALERLGRQPRLVPGNADNLKITHPGDLELAALFLRRREGRE